jgi:hypothetical protein
MADDYRIIGADKLDRLARDLREGGNVKLRNHMSLRMMEAVRLALPEFSKSAIEILPKRGGLNVWVGGSLKAVPVLKLRGKDVAIRVKITVPKARGQADVDTLERGRLKHPVFGRPVRVTPWVIQVVKSQFIDHALKGKVIKAVRKGLIKIIDDVAKDLAGK